MRIALCLISTAVLSGAAFACPATLADAEKGILVTYAVGETAVLTRDPATGDVSELFTDIDGYRMQNRIGNGIHLLGWTEVDSTGTVVEGTASDYILAASPPAELAPGTRWTIPYRITGAWEVDGGTYSGQVGVLETLQIGPCSYEVLPVTMTYREDDIQSLVRVDYVPELGLGLLRATGLVGGETKLLTPIAIMPAVQP